MYSEFTIDDMHESKTSVPVFLIFFNRPDTFRMVFDEVKKARPAQLFLACDGPRQGRMDDIMNTEKCKIIAADIDWKCEVHLNYSEENLGCGMRMTSGLNWMFEKVDRAIILEDDCVPSQDFFPFCEDLLERYKDDERICHICAMNHLGVYEDCPNDYFFGPACCWGWATWKRVWMNMDFEMNFLNDDYSMRCVESTYPYYSNARKTGVARRQALQSGKKLSAWTYQMGISTALQGQMSILPKVNLVTNVGLSSDSVHAVNNIKKLPKVTQSYFNMPIHPVSFPLKHPAFVVEDRIYHKLVNKKFQTTFLTKIESIIRRLWFAEAGERKNYFNKAITKLMRK